MVGLLCALGESSVEPALQVLMSDFLPSGYFMQENCWVGKILHLNVA